MDLVDADLWPRQIENILVCSRRGGPSFAHRGRISVNQYLPVDDQAGRGDVRIEPTVVPQHAVDSGELVKVQVECDGVAQPMSQ